MSTSREERLSRGSASTTVILYPSSDAPARSALILAHGAGAGQRSPFMVSFARAISSHGIDVLTFDFPYIEQRRRIPDRGPVLEACYRAMVEHAAARRKGLPCFIGGKSMGGRIATQVAAADPALPISGLVLLGYPLHPPGKPSQRRDAHLPKLHRPMLFVQGSRDAFGTPAELEGALELINPKPELQVIEGGDHSFKVPRDGDRQQTIYEQIQSTIVRWMLAVSSRLG